MQDRIKVKKIMKAEDLVKLIRKRYEGDAYVVLEQVPNATGAYQLRWVDVAVFSLWPSQGLTRSAFEIKVARSDFIHELQNIAKYKWAKDSFHEFWFVTLKGIVQSGELPEGVGLMEVRGSKLVIKKHCQRNDNPLLDDLLLAGFMRAANKEIVAVAKRDKQELLESDQSYTEAQLFRKAVEAFLVSRGVSQYFFDPTVETIKESLDEATLDRELKQERQQVLYKLGEFQRSMASLFSIFAVIAHRALIERDDVGEFIISKFGGHDEEALKTLQGLKKGDSYQERYAELINIILTWGNLRK